MKLILGLGETGLSVAKFLTANNVEFKIAEAYYKLGKNDKAKEIVGSLLENQKISRRLKVKLITLKFKLSND